MRIHNGFGILACAAVLGTSACATITYDTGTLERVVAMNRVAEAATFERVGSFQAKQRAGFVLAALITVMDADLERGIQRELSRTGGDAIINLRIHEEYDVIDALISVVQSALIGVTLLSTRSITLEGDVVRWRTAMTDEDQQRLGLMCREIELGEEAAGRVGHICIPAEAALVE